jgi:hypothetical protein
MDTSGKVIYDSRRADGDYYGSIVEGDVEAWFTLIWILLGHLDFVRPSIISTYTFAHLNQVRCVHHMSKNNGLGVGGRDD